MARLVFLISLTFAFLALHEWPDGPNAWIRALLALGSMLAGTGFVVLSASASKARRFSKVRQPGALEKSTNGLCIALTLGLFYFILVFGPEKTRQFSEFVFASFKQTTDRSGTTDEDTNPVSSDQAPYHQGHDFEIGTVFDPSGAPVPDTARLISSEEPQVSLITPDNASAQQLRQTGFIYLNAFSHHAFDGERWITQSVAGPQKLTHGPDGLIHLRPSDATPAYQYTILPHRERDSRSTLNTLHGVHFVRLPELMQLNPGTWLLPAPANTSREMDAYQAASSPLAFEEVLASGAPVEPGMEDPAYLAATTDANLKLQIETLSARFRNPDPLAKRLIDLQHWFATSFTYSRQVAYPDNGKSALENFLTDPECNEGFCVHFASAAVLMLREMGVPARISYGWTGGMFYEGHHQFVFRGEDAHAWAEIYLKGLGWVVFDTTPASALPQSDAAPPGATPPAAENPAETITQQPLAAASLAPWQWMLAALSTGVAALFLLLLLKHRELSRGKGSDRLADAISTAPEYLQLFHQACSRRGHPKPVGLTLLQHLMQLDRAGIPIPFADEFLTYHYNVAYRGVPRDPRFERQLCAQIKTL